MKRPQRRYAHLGPSTRGLLDPVEVLQGIGLRPGQVVLDAGSGDGHFAIPAAALVGDEGRVYAVDVREEAIAALREEIRRRGIGNLEAMVADVAERVPLPGASVDVALAANVVHEFVENGVSEEALREIGRVLKVGGTLAVVDFRPDGDPEVGPRPEARLSSERVEGLAGRHGFRRMRAMEPGPEHYGLIFQREE